MVIIQHIILPTTPLRMLPLPMCLKAVLWELAPIYYSVEDVGGGIKAQLRGLAFATADLELVFQLSLLPIHLKGLLLISKRLGNKSKSYKYLESLDVK